MKRRKWVIGCFILLFFFAALIPQIGSTSLGKVFFIRAMELRFHSQVKIDSLSLSWLGPQKIKGIQISHPDLEGSIQLLESDVPFWSLSSLSKKFQIENGSFSFPSYGEGTIERVNGQIEGNHFQLSGLTQHDETAGYLSLKGTFFSSSEFSVQIDFKNVPSAVLDSAFQANGLLFQALGATLDLRGAANRKGTEGSIDLDLSAVHAQGVLRGNLSDTALTLREPLDLTFILTPELSELLLRKANPLFLTGVESKNPISLKVSPQNFSYPYRHFSLEEFRIGEALLDMGRIKCRNGKSLASLISLLKASQLANDREMNVWFTPVAFRLEKGILQTGRMDALLADSIHVCTWGSIDLLRDAVHMFLGLPADTLRQSFGIQNLSPNYVLKIPIAGSTQDPELEKGVAAAKIAAMIAGQQLPKKTAIFGDLVKGFIQAKDDQEVPPAKRPFPWERK